MQFHQCPSVGESTGAGILEAMSGVCCLGRLPEHVPTAVCGDDAVVTLSALLCPLASVAGMTHGKKETFHKEIELGYFWDIPVKMRWDKNQDCLQQPMKI